MMPDRIGGRPGGDKPALSVTVIRAKPDGMPDRIGGPPGARGDSEDTGDVTAKETQRDLAKAIIANLTAVKPNADRLADDLFAFFRSAQTETEIEPGEKEEGN